METTSFLDAPETATSVALPFAYANLKVGMVGSGAVFSQVLMTLHALEAPIVVVATHELAAAAPREAEALDGVRQLGLYQDPGAIGRRIGARYIRDPDPNAPACIQAMKACGVNLVLSVSAPLLREEFVSSFSGLVFNIHGQAAYRGRAGLTWALLNDLRADHVVLHWVTSAIDAGKVVVDQPYAWPAGSYPLDLMRAQFQAYEPLLAGFLAVLRTGRIPCRDPGREAKLYFPLVLGERDGLIRWEWPPETVEKFVRAFGWPYVGAFGYLLTSRQVVEKVIVARCQLLDDQAGAFHPHCNGVPVRYGPSDSVDVVTGGRLLRLLTLRNGWKELPARARVRLGGRFVSAPAGDGTRGQGDSPAWRGRWRAGASQRWAAPGEGGGDG